MKEFEFTLKAILIGIVLALVFCGANVYLGLKIGSTISASIPASILAMGFLRMFKKYSVLENSISQTTASTGEATAAVIIFVFPALLILGVWDSFSYWDIVVVGIPGLIIGVIYSIILRKVLLKDETLAFPEGQAIGQVLSTTTNTSNKSSIKALTIGMIVSAVLTFCQSGLQILASGYDKIVRVGGGLIGGGTSFSAAIIGAGFLVGFNPMLVGFIALIISWCIFLPIFTISYGIHDSSDLISSAYYTWQNYIRPIGIGVMIFSGFATIIMLIKPIMQGVRESIVALKHIGKVDHKDQDLNIKKLGAVLLITCFPIIFLIHSELNGFSDHSSGMNFILAIAITVATLIIGFIIAAVAGYFAGLVGSSTSPISGLLFIAVIAISLMLHFLVTGQSTEIINKLLTTIVLLVGFIGFTAAITNGSVQDYKSGQIVNATPYKQQLALFIGSIVSILIAPLFINLVFHAYGIAGIVPHAGIDPNNTLSAPQASAVAMLTKNIIHSTQNWNLINYGLIIGAIALIIDIIGKRSGKFRCPMLSVGLGIYLPPSLVSALFIGGILRLVIDRKHKQIEKTEGKEVASKLHGKTNLLICGLVAGESLMGLLLAIPFVLKQSSDALKIVGNGFVGISQALSAIVTIALLYYIYRSALKRS